MTYNSLFGFLALITYITTLIPSNLVKVFPDTKKWQINRFLLKYRRFLGLTAFSLSTNHALISIAKYNINPLSLETYRNYYTGTLAFIIFSILAFTSNNWSIRKLKRKWKVLHRFTYVAMFLLFWHILTLMEYSWTFLTPIALYLMNIISFIFLIRVVIESVELRAKKRNIEDKKPKILAEKSNQAKYDL
ncbi:Iron reductase [Hyella patelloides LEGE 07179]|uniref:Iron reductase n=1 Tax=Hyella patelloides LEGE 07179 TaxID=945734 RepID=A0A563W369_9CYAN|nr:ferric reductase-like transmembrane domain-containing protein [Hyella patelloides]VEP18138.1 Iron reductase [Hyella patelloides LEGE 07179]